MTVLKQGDHVLMEHPHMRETFVVAQIVEAPNKATIEVRYYRRIKFDQTARELDTEGFPRRRSQKAVVGVLPDGADYALLAEQAVARCEAYFVQEKALKKLLRDDLAKLGIPCSKP